MLASAFIRFSPIFNIAHAAGGSSGVAHDNGEEV